MAEIIKVYREELPSLRLIGKRYTNSDRGANGSFSGKWGEWFKNGYFGPLEKLGALPENGDAYLGLMRITDEFEYWIGMFFPEGTPVPEGYEYTDFPAGSIGTCWIYGREDNGEIFGEKIHNKCLEKVKEKGWELTENAVFFERYNCPRYTNADEKGNVILDYCMYIKV